MLRRSILFSNGVLRIRFLLRCIVPTDDDLRLHVYGFSTEIMSSLLRFTVVDSVFSARTEPWLARMHKTCVVGITFWPMTEPTMDEDAIEFKYFLTYRSRRCCRCSLRPLSYLFLSREYCRWKRTVLKKVFSIVVAVISFAKEAVLSDAEKWSLLIAERSR